MSADPKRSAESLKIELLDKASRWAVPGSRLLPTDRTADLQSGSPPVVGTQIDHPHT